MRNERPSGLGASGRPDPSGRGNDFDGLSPDETHALRALCRIHGVRTRHADGFDREVSPSPETLSAVLRAMDVPLASGPADAPDALRALESWRERTLVPPTVVQWTHEPDPIVPGGPALDPHVKVEVRLELEQAGGEPRTANGGPLRKRGASEGGGVREWILEPGPGRRIRLPEAPPPGYHTLHVSQGGGRAQRSSGTANLIVAPSQVFSGPEGADDLRWGLFLPLHALRHRGDWGVGDLSGLGRFARWTRERGGHVVGTLPLLAAFLDEPFEPSPYAPASRLFWNELYLDPRATPEWEASPDAAAHLDAPEIRDTLQTLRYAPRVRYREVWRLKRALLDILARTWADVGGPESGEFRTFAERRPELADYATFRAVREERGDSWDRWPASWRSSGIPDRTVPRGPYLRHLYAQFRTAQQVETAAQGLYLDLPLGTHGEGYDVWARPDLFAEGISGGAPPDGFHPHGQTWGFPPTRPDTLRRGDGLGYFAACVRHLMDPSEVLRIDHVMGLHRMYWVPEGADGRDGAYVANPARELYAILALESHRARASVVGEDLGTVPPEVRESMEGHGLRRMYVLPFEVDRDRPEGLAPVPDGALAVLGTHDMPPFAAFWRGSDIDGRVERGALDPGERAEEEANRGRIRRLLSSAHVDGADASAAPGREGAIQAHRALLARLGRTPAGLVLANVEDLWGEETPQNVPGTPASENWRQRARHPLEAFDGLPDVVSTLDALREAREEARRNGPLNFQPGDE